MYRCVATSVEGFVQQVAVSYILHRYFYILIGGVPKGIDSVDLDSSVRSRYGLEVSKWVRARRRKKGGVSVQYLRYRGVFVLVAAGAGVEAFGSNRFVDIREVPIRLFGYEIGCYLRKSGRWHPSIRVERASWRRIVRWFRRRALNPDRKMLEAWIRRIPFAPFAAVCGQVFRLVIAINRRRRFAGLPPLSTHCIRQLRKPVKVFDGEGR